MLGNGSKNWAVSSSSVYGGAFNQCDVAVCRKVEGGGLCGAVCCVKLHLEAGGYMYGTCWRDERDKRPKPVNSEQEDQKIARRGGGGVKRILSENDGNSSMGKLRNALASRAACLSPLGRTSATHVMSPACQLRRSVISPRIDLGQQPRGRFWLASTPQSNVALVFSVRNAMQSSRYSLLHTRTWQRWTMPAPRGFLRNLRGPASVAPGLALTIKVHLVHSPAALCSKVR